MQEYAYQEKHMGTTVVASFVTTEETTAAVLAHEVFAEIRDYEQRFSRFLPESELSHLNREGQAHVSPTFLHVLQAAIPLVAITDGAFNPLVQVSRLGYRQSITSLVGIVRHDPTPYNTNIHELSIDSDQCLVKLAPGQQLDFGGFLKGYLAEHLANKMSLRPEVQGVVINIGGDVAARGVDALHEAFIFFVYNPITGEEIPVALSDAVLATSGTYQRTWQTSVGNRHHIVDSVSRDNPDTGLVSVSIIHSSGARAEAFTKLFLTRGVSTATTILAVEPYQYIAIDVAGVITTNLI